MFMDTEDAFSKGFCAYWNGVDSNNNPYAQGSKEYVAWDMGWSEGQLADQPDELV
jgi:hypothetical protein